MGTPLRILLIDDDPDDRSLFQRTLRREFPDLLVTEISESEDLARALDGAMPDLVITDSQLRWTDGLAVLRAVKDRWTDAPVLMVTGTGSELIAVEAMKAGLDDYILKAPHHLIRLPAAARAALDRAVQRRALRESEARYRSFFESSIDAILLTVSDGTILAANPAACRIFGRTEEEIRQVGRAGVIDPTDTRLPMLLEERARTGMASGELTFVRKDGTKFPGEVSSALFTDRDGPPKTNMTIRDVTERKRAEEALRESEERYRLLIDQSPYAIGVHQDGKVLFVNPSAVRLFGAKSAGDLTGKPLNALLHPETWEAARERIGRMLKGETGLYPIEDRYVRLDGSEVPVEVTAAPFTHGGRPAIQVIALDITERKRAEEALRESKARYRSLFEHSLDGIMLTMPNGRILAANPEACRMVGRTEEEICRLGRAGVVDVEDPRLPMLLAERARTGKSRGELTFIRQDGSKFPAEASSSTFKDRDGQDRTSVIIRDITERKRVEDKLRETETRYRTLFEQSPAGVLIIDPETAAVLDANDTAHRQLGYSRDEFLRLRISDFEVIETPEEIRARMENVLRIGRDEFETRHRTKQGEIRNFLVTLQTIVLSGRPVLQSVFGDITKRKRAEAALLDRTQQLEAIRAVSEEVTQELDLVTLLDLINRRAAELVGGVSGTVYLWDETAQALVPAARHGFTGWAGGPPRRLGEGVVGTVAQRRRGMIVNDYRTSPYAYPLSLASTPITAVLAEPLLYRDRLLGVITIDIHGGEGTFTERDRETLALFATQAAIAIQNARLHQEAQRDLAERQRKEEALRVSEEFFRRTFDESPVGAAIVGLDYRYQRVNAALCQITGYTAEELTSLTFPVVTHPGDVADDLVLAQRLLMGEIDQFEKDERHIRKDGDIAWMHLHVRMIRDAAGQPTYFLPMIQDITERKRAEQARDRLLRQLITAEERERRRIARELHDETAQSMTSLLLGLQMIESVCSLEEVRARSAGLRSDVAHTLEEIHRLAEALRPSLLDDFGLVAALGRLVDGYKASAAATGAQIDFSSHGLEGVRLATHLETTLYRVLQEAVTNAVKHAGARTISVLLERRGQTVVGIVEDDGQGFEVQALAGRLEGGGLGLVGIQERVTLTGGTLVVESTPGRGTTVVVEFPLERQPEA